MKNVRFLLSTFYIIITMIFIYSCAKDGSTLEAKPKEISVQNRASGSACSPQSLYPIFTGCNDLPRSITIDFTLGLSLYSTGSTIYQLCPGVSFNVNYTFTTCYYGSNPIYFVHNLDYNIADIIAACPALQAEISNQQALGNLVGFLDLLDFDISKQVEFREAYIAALQASPTEYLCENRQEFYDIKYIQNSCFKWVPFLDESKERPIPAFKKEECNESICCIRIGQYCVDGFFNGQPVLQGSGRSTYERTEGICPLDCTHECGDPDSI